MLSARPGSGQRGVGQTMRDLGDLAVLPRSAAHEAVRDRADGGTASEPDTESQEALETIEIRCLELSMLARRAGLRHIDYLLLIAAQEAAARRTPRKKRARAVSPDDAASGLRRHAAADPLVA